MDFFTEHYNYIFATATAKAVDIVRKTGVNDLEDFRQEILIFLFRRLNKYDASKGTAHTYINVCMESARKNIIRNIYRMQKRNHTNIAPIDIAEDVIADDSRSQRIAEMQEYILTLPDPVRSICLDYFINGVILPVIAHRSGRTQLQIVTLIRIAMRGYIDEL